MGRAWRSAPSPRGAAAGGFPRLEGSSVTDVQTGTVTTKVPARLDRLPWSRWHWMIVIGLGTVWVMPLTAVAAAPWPQEARVAC